LLVLETLKRDLLEVEDPPSSTYVEVLPVASSMEPMELGQTDSTTVVNGEARDTLDHTCDFPHRKRSKERERERERAREIRREGSKWNLRHGINI